MRLIHTGMLVLVVFLAGCSVPQLDTATNPAIHGQEVSEFAQLPFEQGEYSVVATNVSQDNVSGYLASPVGVDDAPGVVLIHEWWGLNSHIKETADKLASHGYRVFAVDLYNGQVAQDASQARQLVTSVNQTHSLASLSAAQTYLESLGSENIASLGFCFGGGQSMALAVSENAPDASIVFYGNPITDERVTSMDQPFLGIFGQADQSISLESVNALDTALDGVTNHSIIVYEGANHAFANPSGDRFNQEAAMQAWDETLTFLEMNLR